MPEVGLKLKTLGELLAAATETEAALKDQNKKEKGGRRSEEASLLKLKRKNQSRYKSLEGKAQRPREKERKRGRSRQRKSLSKNLKSGISMKARALRL